MVLIKSVFCQILRKKICFLPNSKGLKSVYTGKISMRGRSADAFRKGHSRTTLEDNLRLRLTTDSSRHARGDKCDCLCASSNSVRCLCWGGGGGGGGGVWRTLKPNCSVPSSLLCITSHEDFLLTCCHVQLK